MLWINKINKGYILSAVFLAVLILSLSSCTNDSDVAMEETSSHHDLKLSFVIPNAKVATRADSTFVDGSGYETQIDITNHDYKIYFFSYEGDGDESAGTLLAQFTPTRTVTSTSEGETLYTVSGIFPEELLEITNFRVVVLANWGDYPEVEEGTTTIDDLTEDTEDTEGTYSTFLAEDKFSLSSSQLIPFYGVQEFSGVNIIEGGITELPCEVYLLRALAKVEIVLYGDSYLSFSDVILHNYNAEGYSAPEGIYTADDYHTGSLDNDYVQSLHLVNDGQNDATATENSIRFEKTKNRVVDSNGEVTYETWELYIPEYDNTSEGVDPAYIEVRFNNQLEEDGPYYIYFKNYESDGTLDENATTWDIHRNNLYRFNVSLRENDLLVNVADWYEAFDNEWTFGNMDGTGEILPDGEIFYIGLYAYEVIDSENQEVEITYDTANEGDLTNYQGVIVIPEIVRYDGVDYTVVAINEEAFYYGQGITSVSVPATVTKIGYRAFYDCENMETFTCYAENPPTCEDEVFSEADTDRCILYVPQGCVDTYSETSPWSSFTDIQEIVE